MYQDTRVVAMPTPQGYWCTKIPGLLLRPRGCCHADAAGLLVAPGPRAVAMPTERPRQLTQDAGDA